MTRTYRLDTYIEEPNGVIEFMVSHDFGCCLDATNEARDRMYDWCVENFGEEGADERWYTSASCIVFVFLRPADATLFKLTWG